MPTGDAVRKKEGGTRGQAAVPGAGSRRPTARAGRNRKADQGGWRKVQSARPTTARETRTPAGESGHRERAWPVRKLARVSPRTVILLILLLLFIGFAAGPTLRNLEANSRLSKKQAELESQKAATSKLEREVAKAKSMTYIEEEARVQRLVKPGEVLYLVTTDDASSPVVYKVKSLQSMGEAWERVRAILHCAYVPPARSGE
jgi:cell division protein FtsB